jgi:hypothetical protein
VCAVPRRLHACRRRHQLEHACCRAACCRHVCCVNGRQLGRRLRRVSAGSYGTQGAASSSVYCTACAAGAYSAGSSGAVACTACPAGSYAGLQALLRAPRAHGHVQRGRLWPDLHAPPAPRAHTRPCPPAPAAAPSASQESMLRCTVRQRAPRVSTGAYATPVGATNPSVCTSCTAGTYAAATVGATSCVACGPGVLEPGSRHRLFAV